MATQPGIARRLVGRQAELAVARDHIEAVLASDGGLLLLSGEAGVGKSRLVAEILDRFARAAPNNLALSGNCFEGDRSLAYAPLLDLLRGYSTFSHPVDPKRLFVTDPAAFVTLLPEFQSHFPDIQPLIGAAPEQEQRRIFQALFDFVTRLAADHPLIIVFEDLHWSDDSSLEFLVHLARSIQTLPVFLVGTFRSEEERPRLRRALVEIERARLGVELQLTRLAIDEVDHLLRDIFSQPYPIRQDFLHAIYGMTDGNPFFVEEVVRSLIAAGDIYEARGRWTRKDLAQLRIPRSFALLQRLTGYPEPELLGALRALIDAGLISEQTADRFGFRHALIRQAVYEGLLARERRVRHGQVAEAIEDLHSEARDRWLADLVYHFYSADRWEKAFHYAAAAGERAQSLFTPQAAIEHFTHALEAAGMLGRTPPIWLLRQRGRAHETLGDYDAARQDFHAALEIAREAGDLRAEWETLVDLGRSWEGLDYTQAGSWFERALELARQLDDPQTLAHSLNRVGTWRLNTERVDEARSAHIEALAIFEEIEDELGIAATVDYLGMVATIAGDLIEMRDRYQRAAVMFERLGDRQRLSSTLATMIEVNWSLVLDTVTALTTPTYDETRIWGTRAVQLAREAGWRSGEAYALMTLGLVGLVKADYARAFPIAAEAVEVAREIEHREWLSGGYAALGSRHHDILNDDLAIEYLEQAVRHARASKTLLFQYLTLGILADALVDQGRLDGARTALASLPPSTPMRTVGQRKVWSARANVALATGDADESLEILDRLFQKGHNITSQRDIPLLAWRRGRALAQLGRTDEAEEALLAARAGGISLDQPGKIWRINLELAELYRSLGRMADASHALQSARETVAHISPGIPDEDLRLRFLARSTGLFDAVDGGQSESRTALSPLTTREREVALLVARGLSNRRIADELYIGERTVETHVSNILAKLGFDSRTQVAAWVVEHRPAQPETPSRPPRSRR